MTIEEWNNELREKRDIFNAENAPVFIAASDTLAKMSERIFTDGQNFSGQRNQYNSTTPIYLNVKKNRVTQPKGKPGASRNLKKPRKTAYFSSYKAYRDEVGLDSSKVVFENIGDLRSDFENVNAPGAENPIQGPSKPSLRISFGKRAYQIKITRKNNVEKSFGLDKKYGVVFKITPEETKNYIDTLKFEFEKLIQ